MKDNSSSSLLRGATAESSVSIDEKIDTMTVVKDVATSNLNFIEQMQELHKNGNKERLGEMMKSMLHDHKDLQNDGDIDYNLVLPDLLQGFDLESIPPSDLADMFDPDMYNEVEEQARGLVPILGDAGTALRDLKEHRRRLEEEDGYKSSGYGTRYTRHGGGDPFKNFESKFNPRDLRIHPMIKNSMLGMKGGFQLPSQLKKYLKGKNGASRERRRRLQEEDPDCQEPCDIDDEQCNCQTLRRCVKEMQSYDFAVLYAGQGYIDDEGHFTIPAEELNLFDVDDELPVKIARIKALADEDTSSCNALLEEFHTACPHDQQTCSAANNESYALTIKQVCDAVNTPTLLKIDQIAEAYDGFAKLGGGPFVDGTVDNTVLDWYTSQESGEDYCGVDDTGEEVPLTCQVEWLDSESESDGVYEECKTKCRNKLNAKLKQEDLVWTQSVSPPDGNINQCDSVSYEVCGEFVQSFDKLYNATEEINPMLTDPNQPWWHAKLLVEYEFDTDEHGIKRLSGGYVDADLYDYGKGQEFPGKVSVIFVL